MREKMVKKETDKINDLSQSVMKPSFDTFALQKPSLPCNFQITNLVTTLQPQTLFIVYYYSRLELFINKPYLETATSKYQEPEIFMQVFLVLLF